MREDKVEGKFFYDHEKAQNQLLNFVNAIDIYIKTVNILVSLSAISVLWCHIFQYLSFILLQYDKHCFRKDKSFILFQLNLHPN